MKYFTKFCLIGLLVICALVITGIASPSTNSTDQATGIYLDTLRNEVVLHYVDGHPSYYYSKIFTPVCETGECKPIYINIYWDLLGNYSKYDLPEGEELTKQDHIPFTKSDYELLHEVLLDGDDPRYGLRVKRSDLPEGGKKDKEEQSSPSPANALVLLSKTEMVDAVSGATRPQMKGRFVPGALYTTYTCWDLANTHQGRMFNYTKEHVFVREHYKSVLSSGDYNCMDQLVRSLGEDLEHGHANVLMQILDTSETENLRVFAVRTIEHYDLGLDTVSQTLHRTYFSTQSARLRKEILARWSHVDMSPKTALELATSLSSSDPLFEEITETLNYQGHWPDELVDELIRQVNVVEHMDRKKAIFFILSARQDKLSKRQQKAIKQVKARYNW